MSEGKPQQNKTEVVFEAAEGEKIVVGKHHHRGVTVLLEPDELVREQATGFANFLRDYAVVGLATGFIIGQEANTVVKQLVASFIQPWLQVLFGSQLTTRVAILHHDHTPIQVQWGTFVYDLVEFFFVVVSIYLVIKLFRLDKLKKR
jgi:large conductance mechanosensitive channel protein